ncbi:MAG: flagellar filament capping protein FliD [Porticoccaceae bacterium]
MLTATGIGSGLDIESLVSQLVAAERSPVESRLVNREASLTAELSGLGSLKNAVAAFQTGFSSLNTLATFGKKGITSSNSDAITASASQNAIPGDYSIAVSQLATAHSLASGTYDSAASEVGTGTITIRFGSTDYTPPDPGPESYDGFTVNPDRGTATITIDSSNNTLAGIKDAINGADIGVNAVIVNDGNGYRLLLNSEESGADNSLEISVSSDGDGNNLDGAGLSALAFNSAAVNLSQTVDAQNAVFSVNGLSIESSGNVASDVISGVSLTLKQVTESPVTLSISEDQESVSKAIESFVSGYNQFIKTYNQLTAYDPATGNAGTLQGDISARSIASRIKQIIGSVVSGVNGPFSSLSELGITTQDDGTLAIDSARLDEQLSNHFSDVVRVFAAIGTPEDDLISFTSSSSATGVGDYAVNITQLATRGQYSGAAITFPLVVDDDNDGFSIKVNGVTSGAIQLTQGSYANGESLASEIQARINGDSQFTKRGLTVEVTFNVDHFEITSSKYGSSSKVEILSVDANSSAILGLSVVAGTDGVDVAGTIGGFAATGSGQFLTGATGTDVAGLKLLIGGGSLGDRGSVSFTRGIAYQLNALVNSFLDTDGLLDSRIDGIQSRIDDINDDRERLDRRMESLEARYRAQFNALDTLLSQLQSTSDFLSQQLSSLPGSGLLLNQNS